MALKSALQWFRSWFHRPRKPSIPTAGDFMLVMMQSDKDISAPTDWVERKDRQQ